MHVNSASAGVDRGHIHHANGNAHGVLKKIGTGHYNPRAEARLSALFADRIAAQNPTPAPAPVEPQNTEPETTDPRPTTPVDIIDIADVPVAPDEPVIFVDETPREPSQDSDFILVNPDPATAKDILASFFRPQAPLSPLGNIDLLA